MALENTGNNPTGTSEEEVMAKAKEYAFRDHKQSWELIQRIVNSGEEITEAVMAKHLLALKYDTVKNARTNRISFYD